MNEYILAEAMGGISDELLLEAAEMEKKRSVPIVLRRVAAIAAVLAILLTAALWPSAEESYVTGPGLLVVRAYAADDVTVTDANSTVMEEGVELPQEYCWNPSFSIGPIGFPIKLSISEEAYPGMDITFDIRLDAGTFLQDNPDYDWKEDSNRPAWTKPDTPAYPDWKEDSNHPAWMKPNTPAYLEWYGNFTIGNNQQLFWKPSTPIKDPVTNETIESIFPDGPSYYVDIAIRADDHIVGYAVVEIFNVDRKPISEGGVPCYCACLLSSGSFPKVDGGFQNVSEKYLEQLFESIHKSN